MTASGYLPGDYTKFGEVSPLLTESDDTFVIYGRGDELALRYDSHESGAGRHDPQVRRLREGLLQGPQHRRSQHGRAAAVLGDEQLPVPGVGAVSRPTPSMTAYQAEWNTRHEGFETTGVQVTEEGVIEGVWSGLETAAVRAWDKAVALFTPTAGGEPVEGSVTLHRSLNTDIIALDVAAVGASSDNSCSACHAPHGGADAGVVLTGGRAAADGRTCTADGTGGCHDDAANSASGVDIRHAFTENVDPRAHHDVMPADQRASGGRTACGDCHNPHKDNAAVRFSDPDNAHRPHIAARGIVATTGVSGRSLVRVMTGAARISQISSHRTVNFAVIADGDMDDVERASTSWIDWGTTTAYELGNEASGAPFGNNTMVLSHSVQMSSLTTGTVYHYRVRSTDILGNTSLSEDRTYKPTDPPPAPVMSDVTTVTGAGCGLFRFPCPAPSVASSDGHAVQYWFEVGRTGLGVACVPVMDRSIALRRYLQQRGSWRATPSTSSRYLRGPRMTASIVTGSPEPVESCPNLFAWNGERFEFVTDVMGLGESA